MHFALLIVYGIVGYVLAASVAVLCIIIYQSLREK